MRRTADREALLAHSLCRGILPERTQGGYPYEPDRTADLPPGDLPWPHHRRAGGYRVPAQWQYLHTGGGTPPGGVGILALDDEGCAVLVEQYRYVFDRTLLEIPAGKREPGEDPADYGPAGN